MSEVEVLIGHEFYITAVNRLYYACYHATTALLLTKHLFAKTHTGVVAQLHQHFVSKDEFDYEHASFYSRLLQERIEDDYSDFTINDISQILPFVEPGRNYVAYIEGLVNDYFITEAR